MRKSILLCVISSILFSKASSIVVLNSEETGVYNSESYLEDSEDPHDIKSPETSMYNSESYLEDSEDPHDIKSPETSMYNSESYLEDSEDTHDSKLSETSMHNDESDLEDSEDPHDSKSSETTAYNSESSLEDLEDTHDDKSSDFSGEAADVYDAESQNDSLVDNNSDVSMASLSKSELQKLTDINESLEESQKNFELTSSDKQTSKEYSQEEKAGHKEDSKSLSDNDPSSIADVKRRNSALIAQFLGSSPLCYEHAYLSCINTAKHGFQVCSIDNKACQCYYAGAAIVECSKYCSSYNLDSFHKFKNACSNNPYVLNFDEDMYSKFKDQGHKTPSLIKELKGYKNIHNRRKSGSRKERKEQAISDQVNDDDLTYSAYINNYSSAFFDNSKIEEPQWKPFEKENLNGKSDLMKESEIQVERQNYESKKLIQIKNKQNYQSAKENKNKSLDGQDLQNNVSEKIDSETEKSTKPTNLSNSTNKLNLNSKVENGVEESSGSVSAMLQKSHVLGALIVISTSLLI